MSKWSETPTLIRTSTATAWQMPYQELPPGWATITLGEVATIVGGGTPKTSDIANFEEGEIPWITPKDLSGYRQKYIARGARNITRRGLNSSSARLLPANAILFSSRAPIGYVAIASVPVTTNQGFKSFVLPDGIDPSFVYFYLSHSREMVQGLGGGTTFKEISKAIAATIPLPLPPLPEQRRIVAAIERHFSRLDAAIASLERAQANVKRYRTSVLKAACDSELVPTEAHLAKSEGRDYEPADQLLARILSERRARWQAQAKRPRKYREPVAPDTSNLPDPPEAWVWATVEQGLVRSEYGTSVKCSYEMGGLPVLRIPNIARGEINLHDLKYATRPLQMDSASALQVGDVLMCRTNGSVRLIGRTAVVKAKFKTLHSFASYLLRFRFVDTQTLPQWIHIFATSPLGRAFIESNAASSAGQHNVSLKLIHGMPVALPPLAEQRRIVAEVERRLSAIQQAEETVEANLARAERLRQSILKQAFSGKLVPQDPDDEPASALLERIRAEREAARAAAKARRKPKRRRASDKPRARKATAQ